MKFKNAVIALGILLAHSPLACNSNTNAPDVPDEASGANSESNPNNDPADGDSLPDPVVPAVTPPPAPPIVSAPPTPPASPTPVSPAPEVPSPTPPATPPAVTPPATPMADPVTSCADIKKATPTAKSGVFKINITLPGATVKTAVDAYCDMTEDSGGWTLVLSYTHKGGANPALAVMTKTLPMLGADVLGSDDSAKPTVWGHAGNALLKSIAFTEMRFFCKSSTNAKVVHFKSKDAVCKTAITEGRGSCVGVKTAFTTLSGHTGSMPANVDIGAVMDMKDSTLTNNTFGHVIADGPDEMWNIAGDVNLKSWECDSATDNEAANTIHRVWIK